MLRTTWLSAVVAGQRGAGTLRARGPFSPFLGLENSKLAPTVLTLFRSPVAHQSVGGGRLVLAARTAYKGKAGECSLREMSGVVGTGLWATGFGLWATGFGLWARAADFTLGDSDRSDMQVDCGGKLVSAPMDNEVLEPTAGDGQVVAACAGDYCPGQPAVIRCELGNGTAWSVSSCFIPELALQFPHGADVTELFGDIVTLPLKTGLAVRSNVACRRVFALSHSDEPRMVEVERP